MFLSWVCVAEVYSTRYAGALAPVPWEPRTRTAIDILFAGVASEQRTTPPTVLLQHLVRSTGTSFTGAQSQLERYQFLAQRPAKRVHVGLLPRTSEDANEKVPHIPSYNAGVSTRSNAPPRVLYFARPRTSFLCGKNISFRRVRNIADGCGGKNDVACASGVHARAVSLQWIGSDCLFCVVNTPRGCSLGCLGMRRFHL